VVRAWYDAPLTNPSYVNPAFIQYWNSVRPNTGWDKILDANRAFLVSATNQGDGLAKDWTNFDGTQFKSTSTIKLPQGHGADAKRLAMNCALDAAWHAKSDYKANSQKALDTLNGSQDIADFSSAMYATYALTGVGGCNTKVTRYTYCC
jgi:endo-1,4-beta-D-glucanase Y